jgi:hypothetical protein
MVFRDRVSGFCDGVCRAVKAAAVSTSVRAGACLGGLAVASSGALADTPVMEAVEFPVTPASIASEVSDAGASILTLFFGVAIGFILIKKLFWRVVKPV